MSLDKVRRLRQQLQRFRRGIEALNLPDLQFQSIGFRQRRQLSAFLVAPCDWFLHQNVFSSLQCAGCLRVVRLGRHDNADRINPVQEFLDTPAGVAAVSGGSGFSLFRDYIKCCKQISLCHLRQLLGVITPQVATAYDAISQLVCHVLLLRPLIALLFADATL